MDDQVNPQAEVRVSFGPLPNQNVPVEWASVMLTELAKDRAKFGKLLQLAALGQPVAKRGES